MPRTKRAAPLRDLTPEQIAAKLSVQGLIVFWGITATELIRAGVPPSPGLPSRGLGRAAPKRTPKSLLTPELRQILRQCRQLADFWGVTSAELIEAKAPVRSALTAPPASTGSASSQRTCKSYRHPITLETWNGAGAQPEWLKRALTHDGYSVRELLQT